MDTRGKAINFQEHLLPLLQPSCPYPSTFCSSKTLGFQNQDLKWLQQAEGWVKTPSTNAGACRWLREAEV